MVKNKEKSIYQGHSIVDYLKSTGQPSSFSERKTLAGGQGISDYRGTAEQNLQLLSALRGDITKQETAISAETNALRADMSIFQQPSLTIRGEDAVSDIQDLAKAKKAQLAMNRISAQTNQVQVPQKASQALQAPDYLKRIGEKISSDWQDIYEEMKTKALQPSDQKKTIEQEFEKWGVTESFQLLKDITAQSVSVRQELNVVKSQRMAEEQAIRGRAGIDLSFRNRELSEIANTYGRKEAALSGQLASSAAQAQMIQGNLSIARGLAMDIVNAATYDKELEFEKINSWFEFQSDFIGDLNSAETKMLKELRDNALMEYKSLKEEKEQIVDWATNKNTAPAFYGSDISIISLEDATKRVNDYLSLKAMETGEIKETVGEKKTAEIQRIEQNLNASKRKSVETATGFKSVVSEYINPDIYLSERMRTSLSANDFDKRFGHLLEDQSVIQGVKIAGLAKARTELEKSKGTDGYVDPRVYTRLRNDYIDSVGSPRLFDDALKGMLSLKERVNLGLDKL